MTGKREQQRKLKMCVLTKINEKKDVLFGPFSATITKDIRCDAWKSIGQYAQSLGIMKENKNWTYIRDVWWTNIRKMSMEKLDNRKKTGSAGGTNCKETEVDFLVYEILGKESPVLEGLGVAESLTLETEYNVTTDIDIPTHTTSLAEKEKPAQESDLIDILDVPTRTLTAEKEPSEKSDPTELARKNNLKRNVIEEREELILKKTKMTIELLEKEIKLRDLQIQNVERDNYLKDLQILTYESKYDLPRSRFTCNFDQFSLTVYIPDIEPNVNLD